LALDPLASLAVTVQSSPGTYALILGSGVSRSSGIPTGWEVVRILINRLAIAQDGVEPEDPFEWYQSNVGDSPDYSKLIESLGPLPADRRSLLSEYFVPTSEELEQSLKQPSRAHRAIARLVSKGYIKVIVTTNFDKLLEQALTEVGVNPVVITNADSARGALPLQHSACTIVKVNGDYLEPNIKNTVAELATYEVEMNMLLDRVFDEYGIVVCGWSGEWDEALRNALNRNISRRYGSYFAHKGPLGEMAELVLQNRSGTPIEIEDADYFFEGLESKILGLEGYRISATSIEGAKAEVKFLMSENRYRYRLHDLLFDQVKYVLALDFTAESKARPTTDLEIERIKEFEEGTALLNNLLFQLAYYADTPEHFQLLRDVLETISQRKTDISPYVDWMDLEFYPLTLATYAVGVALVSRGRFEPLTEKLPDVEVDRHSRTVKFFGAVVPQSILKPAPCEKLTGRLTGGYTSASDYLAGVVAKWAEGTILPDQRVLEAFETFEFLLSVVVLLTTGDYYFGRNSWSRRFTTFYDETLADFEPQILSGSLLRFNPGDLDAAVAAWDGRIPSHWH